MPFPDAPRVIYEKNPLDRVICQVRFPPILEIDAKPPASFQELIRTEFAEFREKDELPISLPRNIQSEFSQDILRQLMPSEVKNYEFASTDDKWKVNLTRTFLSLSTKVYIRRSEFQTKFAKPLSALNEIYKPSYYSRIGLRYIDIINRAKLNLSEVPWTDLLQPHALGVLGTKALEENIISSAECKYEIQLDDKGNTVRIVTKLVNDDNNEECFVIDSDFFRSGKTEIKDLQKTLEGFHETAYLLMRWLITDRLHDAMGPKPV